VVRTKHKIIKVYDYVANPKANGYRCIHYVYEAVSNKAPVELQGLKVELQLRTLLQHYWATAVESVGMFYGQSIKTGKGDQIWNDFFLLSSAAFAYMENLPLPSPYENYTKLEIARALLDIEIESGYSIFPKLKAIKKISQLHDFPLSKKVKFGSLLFYRNASGDTKALLFPYFCSEEEALQKHGFIENNAKKEDNVYEFVDSVFVNAEPKHLKKIYSNYFLNIDAFMKNLSQFINEEKP
jgi:putative GTP pyrophosphokinase